VAVAYIFPIYKKFLMNGNDRTTLQRVILLPIGAKRNSMFRKHFGFMHGLF
jgi:hypothetical protein